MSNTAEKDYKPFLFVHDYGMGGIWLKVLAPDPSYVVARYPGLEYVPSAPKWMKKNMEEIRIENIDAMPSDLAFLKHKQ